MDQPHRAARAGEVARGGDAPAATPARRVPYAARAHDRRRAPAPATVRASTALPALLALAGCDGCPGDKPFTPYTLDASTSAAPPATTGSGPTDAGSNADAEADAGPRFAAVQAVRAPGDGRDWALPGGKVAPAPPGRAWEWGLVTDLDGDATEDLLAWAGAPDHLRGELWFVPASALDLRRPVVALPADMSAPSCEPKIALSRIGPRSAALQVSVDCPRGAREPERWVAVVRLPEGAARASDAGPPPAALLSVALELRLLRPPPSEALAVTLDGSDLDGDGRDDVTATLTLSGSVAPFAPPGGKGGAGETAVTRWFDRPAGLSRDPSEPEASVRARAAAIVIEARKKQGAAGALASVRQLRRLRASLCEEANSGMISASAGSMRCAETRSVEDLAHAEGLAALTLRDPARALAALGRLEALSTTAGPRRKELERAIAKEFGEVAAKALHTAAAVPSGGKGLELGPLAFEPSGDLLVRGEASTVRVAAEGFAETPVGEIPPWPREVSAPTGGEGMTLLSVEQRCAAPTLLAGVRLGGQKREAALPVLVPVTPAGAPASGACAAVPSVAARVLDVAAGGLVVAVGAELAAIAVGADGGPAVQALVAPLPIGPTVRGTARSPDGSTVALPAGRGVLVWGAGAKLWTGDPARGTTCVPSNAGERLACVVDGKAVIYGKP